MILSTILVITFIVLLAIIVTAIAAGGAAFIIVFGDVIVCTIFIGWIIKHLAKRRKK